jgi:hypothetical protein
VDPTLTEVNSRLQKANPGLSCLFGAREDHYEFVVTADGHKEYFDAVTRFVETSPKIEGWQLVAFRPPLASPAGFKIKMGGVELSPEDVQFQAFDLGEGRLGITLYPKGLTDDNREPLGNACVILLDHTVGEYDAVMKIDSLALKSASESEKGVPLRPLLELPDLLSKRR